MRSLRDERQELIDECVVEERKLREEADRHARLNRAAIVVQSTWRGYMVRQELGKYRNLRKRLKRRKKLAKVKEEAKK